MTPRSQNVAESTVRLLQASTRNTQGRTILTILYLIVLALCFIVPVFYYFRLHCQDQAQRRQRRELAMATMASTAVQQAGDDDNVAAHPEARASRKKYRAERRARILQLLGPVSMVLTEQHFHRSSEHENDNDDDNNENDSDPSEETKTQIKDPTSTDNTKRTAEEDSSSIEYDIEEGRGSPALHEEFKHDDDDLYAEENDFVEIPSSGANGSDTTRLVPCLCVICLQQYEVGEEIVWSSNPDCGHCFHSSCIEHWLIKQRGGPLCPCCRRDFIIDPFDLETPSHDEEQGSNVVIDFE